MVNYRPQKFLGLLAPTHMRESPDSLPFYGAILAIRETRTTMAARMITCLHVALIACRYYC